MTNEECSQSNLDLAVKTVDRLKKYGVELDDVGTDFCITFMHEFLNDLTIRKLDLSDFHFQRLSARFDDICESYQASGHVTAQLNTVLNLCNVFVDQTILAWAEDNPCLVERAKEMPKWYKQVARVLSRAKKN